MQPYVLLWLRYTAFILLYPLGVGSELAMVALAMPSIRQNRPLSIQVSARRARKLHARTAQLHPCAAMPAAPAACTTTPPPALPLAPCLTVSVRMPSLPPPCPALSAAAQQVQFCI